MLGTELADHLFPLVFGEEAEDLGGPFRRDVAEDDGDRPRLFAVQGRCHLELAQILEVRERILRRNELLKVFFAIPAATLLPGGFLFVCLRVLLLRGVELELGLRLCLRLRLLEHEPEEPFELVQQLPLPPGRNLGVIQFFKTLPQAGLTFGRQSLHHRLGNVPAKRVQKDDSLFLNVRHE